MLQPSQFPIIEVSPDAVSETEDMGTKEKFWFYDPDRGRCLYKKARSNTGEDWSEKIASELCDLLNLPHSTYELAIFQGERGVISPSFVPDDGEFIHGNNILGEILSNYPQDIKNPSQHTLDHIFPIFTDNSVNLPLEWTPPYGIQTAIDTFIGYLLLDTWIGNTDRHPENWGFITIVTTTYLAPTYDHASSLGRNESDQQRQNRLTTKDKSFSVTAYVEKCKSCLYAKVGDKKTLTNFDAFCEAAQYNPNAAYIWLDCLARIKPDETLKVLERIPSHLISKTAIEFAQKILEINKNRLLQFQNHLK